MNPLSKDPKANSFPLPILNSAQTRELEKKADADGISFDEMMDRAGKALAIRIQKRLTNHSNNVVLFLIGPGNNGGDGLVAARELETHADIKVFACLLRPRSDHLTKAAEDAGIHIFNYTLESGRHMLYQTTMDANIIVDSLYGIGLRLPLPDDAISMFDTIKSALEDKHSQQNTLIDLNRPKLLNTLPFVIATDCPSGLDVNSGQLDMNTLPADETVTFLCAKPGFFREAATHYVGKLTVATLGVPERYSEDFLTVRRVAIADTVRKQLPTRTNLSDKRSNGRVLIIAGCNKYIGAVALTARAAYRSGAGIIYIASPISVCERLSGHLLEAVWLPVPDQDELSTRSLPVILESVPRVDAIIFGPGIGLAPETQTLLSELLISELPPLIVDADGLTLLSQLTNWTALLPSSVVLTPHQREFARLSGLSLHETQLNRWDLTEKYAEDWNVTLLLKGAFTVISSPKRPSTILPFQLDALATAGTGDVLSGIIGAFLAGGCDSEQAAIAGGFIHALAGKQAQDLIGSSRSVIASDVVNSLGAAFAQLESASF